MMVDLSKIVYARKCMIFAIVENMFIATWNVHSLVEYVGYIMWCKETFVWQTVEGKRHFMAQSSIGEM